MSRSQVKYAVALKPIRIGTKDGEPVTAQPGEVIDVTDWRGNAVDSNIGTGHISLLPTDPDALRTLADSIEEAESEARSASEERQRRLKKPKIAAASDDDDEADEEEDDPDPSGEGSSDPSDDEGDGEDPDEDPDEDDDAEEDEDELPEGLTEGENGWYTASDGEKVRGREAAVEYQQMLNEADDEGDDEDDAAE